MKFSKDRRIEDEVKRLVHEGWTIETGGRHTKLRSPTGASLPISRDPQNERAVLNWFQQSRERRKGK